MRQLVAYIDEAGDEGIGKIAAQSAGGQSRWLVLGACIVSRENDVKLPAYRDKILQRFPLRQSRELHFRNLKHDQKIVACQELGDMPIGIALTFSNKSTLIGTKYEAIFKKRGYLYNYLLRYLLERITEVCHRHFRSEGANLRIVFSRRHGTDYAAMKDYLQSIKAGDEVKRPVRNIYWSIFDPQNIAVENHSKWAGLQLAHCVTSAFFNAVEPNLYGNCEPNYAQLLTSKLLKDAQGRALNCGLTPVPSFGHACREDRHRAFFLSMANEGGQAPGP